MKKQLLALLLVLVLILPCLASCDLFGEEDTSWMANVHFPTDTFVYDGTEKTITLTGTEYIPEKTVVSYTNNKGTEVGTYKAEATLKTSRGTVFTLRSIMVIDYPSNDDFIAYCNDFMQEAYFGEDQIAINSYFLNPSEFDIEHCEASWYGYGGDVNEEIAFYQTWLDDLREFNNATLNTRERYLYSTVEETLCYYIEWLQNGFYLYEFNYISQFGGYPADLTTSLRSYNLNNEQDVKDMIDIIESVPECFDTYVDFADDRITAGIPLSEFTLTKMIEYLDGVVEEGDDFYLGDYLCDKIDDCKFLTDEQKTSYKSELTSLMQNEFIQAHEDLSTALTSRIPTEAGEEYPQMYEKQKEYYEMQIRHLLGKSSLTMEEYAAYIKSELDASVEAVNKAISAYQKAAANVQSDFINYVYSESVFVSGDYKVTYLPYLKQFAETIVPTLASNPAIEIEVMDSTAAKYSNATAYYSLSYLDEMATEYITFNPNNIEDKNDLLSTMAHEGYPGHLYSYVFMKENGDTPLLQKLMHNTAFGEGWATYVEQQLYTYMGTFRNSEGKTLAINYLQANSLLGFLVYTYADLGINYGIDGKFWTASDVKNFMTELGYGVDDDGALEMYNLLIECPTTYTSYGYGMHYFIGLHNNAKEALGNAYNEVDFNTMLLSYGWVGYDILDDFVNTYVANEKYMAFID